MLFWRDGLNFYSKKRFLKHAPFIHFLKEASLHKIQNFIRCKWISGEIILSNFFHNELNFPLGKKGNITINSQIISKEIFLIQTLRGFFDTDGSIYFTKNNSKIRSYPIIELSTHSPLLIQQLKEILEKMGFKPVISFYGDSVKLHGKKNVIKWMQEIGSSNPYKNGRFEIWLKKGYF